VEHETLRAGGLEAQLAAPQLSTLSLDCYGSSLRNFDTNILAPYRSLTNPF